MEPSKKTKENAVKRRQRHLEVLEKLFFTEQCRSLMCVHQIESAADLAKYKENDPQLYSQLEYCSLKGEVGCRAITQREETKKEKKIGSQTNVLLVTFLVPAHVPLKTKQLKIQNPLFLQSWFDALKKGIPEFESKRTGKLYRDPKYQAISRDQFRAAIIAYEKSIQRKLYNNNNWLGGEIPFMDQEHEPIFVERVDLDSEGEAGAERKRVFLIGDLHSSLESLLNILKRLWDIGAFLDSAEEEAGKKTASSFALQKNCYLVFLGDIVDRGPYGIEIVFLVLTLLTANPRNAFFCSGNHETCEMYSKYGFGEEVKNQLVQKNETVLDYTYVLRYLPSAIFLTLNHKTYQLCHGGLTQYAEEQSIIAELLGSEKKYAFLRYYIESDSPDGCGRRDYSKADNLKWGDFNGQLKGVRVGARGNDTLEFGWDYTQKYLKKLGLTAVIGGHQDTSNFTMMILPSSSASFSGSAPNNILVEPDTNYFTLYRPKHYNDIYRSQYALFEPGRDFLACNTSTALAAKGNESGLKYDCFLTLY